MYLYHFTPYIWWGADVVSGSGWLGWAGLGCWAGWVKLGTVNLLIRALELYLFLPLTFQQTQLFPPMLSWPQNYAKFEFNPDAMVAAKTSFFDL
jgi:hypothetical protein